MADLPINQLSASNIVGINDFAAFDIYNPIDGNYYTYKVSFGTLQTLLSVAIGGNFASQIAQLQTSINVANNNVNNKVSKSGDTMSGPLTINSGLSVSNGVDFFSYLDVHNNALKNVLTPVDNYDGVPKIYVDTLFESISSAIPNIANKVNKSGDTMTGSLSLAFDPTNPNEAATKRYTDNRFNVLSSYLPLSGGTMSGNINLSSNRILNLPTPSDNFEASNKKYVDDLAASKYSQLGGIIGGDINLSNTYRIINTPMPVLSGDSVNKLYVDSLVGGVYLPLSGGTMGGNIIIPSNRLITIQANSFSNSTDAINRGYVDNLFGSFLPLSGGTMTGSIVIPAAQRIIINTSSLGNSDAIPKSYVDGLVSGFVKSDGTVAMTNSLNLNNNLLINVATPSTSTQGTNKGYVDSLIYGNFLPLSGGNMTGNLRLSGYTEEVITVPILANTATINLNLGNNFVINLNANINSFNIIYPTNGKAGCSFTLYIVQAASFVVTWTFNQSGVSNSIPTFIGIIPAITTGAGKIDIFAFSTFNSGQRWLGFIGNQGY